MKPAIYKVRIQAAIKSPDGLRRLLDFVEASILYTLPSAFRKKMFAGETYYCPICDSHLSRFLNLHRPYHRWCPVCRSLQRHRLIWLALQKRGFFSSGKPQSMLHIAPEPGLVEHFRSIKGMRYLSADMYNPKAMVQMDICNIHFPDGAFDFILCSHVLEHVQDDRQAMHEFWRVLSPGGWALILVPILSAVTFEDPGITDPAERERLFGQLDHVRSYGPDIAKRLEEAGFQVSVYKTGDFVTDAEDCSRMGLEEDTLFICNKELQ